MGGKPSRAAELGADPDYLAEAFYHAVEEVKKGPHETHVAALAAMAQAIAIAQLAAQVGRIADGIEAENKVWPPAPPSVTL